MKFKGKALNASLLAHCCVISYFLQFPSIRLYSHLSAITTKHSTFYSFVYLLMDPTQLIWHERAMVLKAAFRFSLTIRWPNPVSTADRIFYSLVIYTSCDPVFLLTIHLLICSMLFALSPTCAFACYLVSIPYG